jgi:hypothetical protein
MRIVSRISERPSHSLSGNVTGGGIISGTLHQEAATIAFLTRLMTAKSSALSSDGGVGCTTTIDVPRQADKVGEPAASMTSQAIRKVET